MINPDILCCPGMLRDGTEAQRGPDQPAEPAQQLPARRRPSGYPHQTITLIRLHLSSGERLAAAHSPVGGDGERARRVKHLVIRTAGAFAGSSPAAVTKAKEQSCAIALRPQPWTAARSLSAS